MNWLAGWDAGFLSIALAVTPAPETPEPVSNHIGGGSSHFTFAPPQRRQITIPVAQHAEEDEEEIVMAVLMRVAELEYFT